MSLKSFIKEVSANLSVGDSIYLDCPICYRKKKFGITKYQDKILYQCFSASCSTKGIFEPTLSKEDIGNLLNKNYYPKVQQKVFEIPTHWIEGFNTESSIDLANKYDMIEPYYTHHAFRSATDVRYMRQVFFYSNQKNEVTGAQGRALIKGAKKSFIYPNSVKQPWVIGVSKDAFIVEDIFSAIKLFNIGKTGIALSGTILQEDWLNYFKDYDSVTIALDKDASNKSFEMKKLLQFFCKSVRIVFLQKDFKDMTRKEATAWIK